MSGVDIRSWIANSSLEDDEDHYEHSQELKWSGDERDWPRVIDQSQHAVLQSGTKARTEFLEQQILPLVSRGKYRPLDLTKLTLPKDWTLLICWTCFAC